MKLILRWLVVAVVLAGIGLIYWISRAASGTEGVGNISTTAFWLIGAVCVSLLITIVYQLLRLIRRVRTAEFGSRLALKIMIALGLMALVPGLLLYLVSLQFIQVSVDRFFDVKVEQALDSGLQLGQQAIDASGRSLAARGELAARELADRRSRGEFHITQLESIRRISNAEAIALLSQLGQVIGDAGDRSLLAQQGANELASVSTLSAAAKQSQISQEQLSERSIVVRSVVAIPTKQAARALAFSQMGTSATDLEPDYLILAERLSPLLGTEAERITSANTQYRVLALGRSNLKQIFAAALTLTLLIMLFSAIALSLMLSQTITHPLSALAEATRAVARGDYSHLNPVVSRDEFGVLTQSFNTMTRRIAEATDTMQQNQIQIENARANLATILSNLQSGVMTFDGQLRLRTVNDAACIILSEQLFKQIGAEPKQWASTSATQAVLDVLESSRTATRAMPPLGSAAQGASAAARNVRASDGAKAHWEKQIKLVLGAAERTLVIRCTEIANREAAQASGRDEPLLASQPFEVRTENGYVVVFDDVTRIVDGERQAAWSEVARRLAHEIKNPLTPIQLSAQRLAAKLQSKLGSDDAAILVRGTDTIVSQVSVLKSMVDDFSMYARASKIQFAPVQLNQLVDEVLSLYESMPLSIDRQLDSTLPVIYADAAMLRQVIHNLMQNAIDALLHMSGAANGAPQTTQQLPALRAGTGPRLTELTATSLHTLQGNIVVATRIVMRGNTAWVQLEVQDDGPGVDPTVVGRVFEPYVTTKAKGTGLGLAIVKRIIEEHNGDVKLENVDPVTKKRGAKVLIHLPTNPLPAAEGDELLASQGLP